jgi:hypothetical protein
MAGDPDKTLLKEEAYRLGGVLRNLKPTLPLQFKKEFHAKRWYTDGWYVELAEEKRGLPGVGLTLDRWTSSRERCFWFGFWASHPKLIKSIIESSPTGCKPRLTLGDDDASVAPNGTWTLKEPLAQSHNLRPIYESYDSIPGNYFGIYDLGHHNRKLAFDLGRAMDFYQQVISAAMPLRPDGGGVPTPSAPYVRYVRDYELQILPRHHYLQARFKKHIELVGADSIVMDDSGIDIQFRLHGYGLVLAEIKPCERPSTRFAVRTAMGQLLDYRQRHTNKGAKLLVVLELIPANEDIDLALSNGFGISYPEGDGFIVRWPPAH